MCLVCLQLCKEEGSSPVSLQLLRGWIWACMRCPCLYFCVCPLFMFSVMWSELLMTSAISCPLCMSAREECAFTCPVRTECCMFVMDCTVCSVVCPCQLFCSACMCCLEEVYK